MRYERQVLSFREVRTRLPMQCISYEIINQEHLGNECLVLECMESGKHMVVDSIEDGWINLYAYDAFGQKTKFQMDLKYAGPIRFQSEAAKRRYNRLQEK